MKYEIKKPASGPGLTQAWQAAIGLQQVDGLKVSSYLLEAANGNIAGQYDIDQAQELVRAYYEEKAGLEKEADIAAAGTARALSNSAFRFSGGAYLALHGSIFRDVFEHAGKPRLVNLTKKEWVLRGESVEYAPFEQILPTLEYEFARESEFDYRGLSAAAQIGHIARFVASLWQIHTFREGNTRTAAVFLLKYLRSLGFAVNEAPFAEHSWYFRNALVRSQYANFQRNIRADYSYLLRFLENVLQGANHELRNRALLVQAP